MAGLLSTVAARPMSKRVLICTIYSKYPHARSKIQSFIVYNRNIP